MNPSIIEVVDLTFDYPGFRALDHVNVSIAPGTVTALVGPNGAGKTTLLRCIAALNIPQSGTVHVAGLDVYESPREVHRLMGYLSDNFGLYSELTVAQGLDYAARSQGLATADVAQAVQATAQRMGLQDKLGKLASTAIIHAPRVLLLDEPASGLDPEARSALAQVFKVLQAQGMSLLVSSHILAELDEYSTHMLALNNGRVLEHRALNPPAHGASDGPAERLLRLEFAEPAQAAAAWLQMQPGVHVKRAEDHSIEIGFSGNPAAQARLVGACTAAGYGLTVIAPVTENLQQSYLRSLQAERHATRQVTP